MALLASSLFRIALTGAVSVGGGVTAVVVSKQTVATAKPVGLMAGVDNESGKSDLSKDLSSITNLLNVDLDDLSSLTKNKSLLSDGGLNSLGDVSALTDEEEDETDDTQDEGNDATEEEDQDVPVNADTSETDAGEKDAGKTNPGETDSTETSAPVIEDKPAPVTQETQDGVTEPKALGGKDEKGETGQADGSEITDPKSASKPGDDKDVQDGGDNAPITDPVVPPTTKDGGTSIDGDDPAVKTEVTLPNTDGNSDNSQPKNVEENKDGATGGDGLKQATDETKPTGGESTQPTNKGGLQDSESNLLHSSTPSTVSMPTITDGSGDTAVGKIGTNEHVSSGNIAEPITVGSSSQPNAGEESRPGTTHTTSSGTESSETKITTKTPGSTGAPQQTGGSDDVAGETEEVVEEMDDSSVSDAEPTPTVVETPIKDEIVTDVTVGPTSTGVEVLITTITGQLDSTK